MLKSLRHCLRALSTLFISLFLSMTLYTTTVQAAVMGTQTLVKDEVLRQEVRTILDQEVVKQHLLEMGVTESMVSERVAHMTATELAQIADEWSEIPAGGSAAGLLAFLFVIFVITDALCATDLFTFVKCVDR